jgi:hypothetical protein
MPTALGTTLVTVVCMTVGQGTRSLAQPIVPAVGMSILVYVFAARAQAQSCRTARYCSLALVVVVMNGTMAGPKRNHFDGHVDRTGHTVGVVVQVTDGRKAGYVRSLLPHRILGRGSVRVNLSCSHLAAHMVFHLRMALGRHVDCGAVRRLRVAHSRNPGCSHIHRLEIQETLPVQDFFVALLPCLPWKCLLRCHCDPAGPSPCRPSSAARVAPQLQRVYPARLPSSA